VFSRTTQAQRSRIVRTSPGGFTAQDALLLGQRGYNVTYRRRGEPICAPVLPGVVRPDWPARAPCSCEAMLTGTSALTPYGTTRVLTCPLASRAAWVWYTLDGQPTSFAATALPGDQGLGLFAAIDYRDWLPGHDAPASAFDKPAQCEAHGVSSRADPEKCSTCHLGQAGKPN